MKDSGLWEPGVGDLRDPFPSHAVLLATSLKRTAPECGDVIAKRVEGPGVRGHCVIRIEAAHHLLEPSALFGDGFVHALS